MNKAHTNSNTVMGMFKLVIEGLFFDFDKFLKDPSHYIRRVWCETNTQTGRLQS